MYHYNVSLVCDKFVLQTVVSSDYTEDSPLDESFMDFITRQACIAVWDETGHDFTPLVQETLFELSAIIGAY